MSSEITKIYINYKEKREKKKNTFSLGVGNRSITNKYNTLKNISVIKPGHFSLTTYFTQKPAVEN